MAKADGGSAFPSKKLRHWTELCDTRSQGQPEFYPVSEGGMSLRDYFAGQALIGWLSRGALGAIADEKCLPVAADAMPILSAACYDMADAMLKASKGE